MWPVGVHLKEPQSDPPVTEKSARESEAACKSPWLFQVGSRDAAALPIRVSPPNLTTRRGGFHACAIRSRGAEDGVLNRYVSWSV
jgi:hypothetical protein